MWIIGKRKFKKDLAAWRASIALKADWKADVRRQVLASIRRTPFWQGATIEPKHSLLAGFRYWVWEGKMVKPAVIVFLVFAVISGSSFWTVTAASASLPGDILYPVKITIEKAQVNLVLNEQKKMELEMSFAGKRLEEINEILKQDQENKSATQVKAAKISAALEHFTDSLNTAQKRIDGLQTSQNAGSDKVSVSKIVNTQTNILEQNLLGIKEKIINQEEVASASALASEIPKKEDGAESTKVESSDGAASLTSIEEALDKVDQTNTKSLAVIIEGAAQSQSSELKQVAVDKLQEKIKKVEENIEKITDNLSLDAIVKQPEKGKIDFTQPFAGNETSTLPLLVPVEKNITVAATSSALSISKEVIEEVGEKPAEAKKTIEEAKRLLSDNTENLNKVLDKIQESKAIVNEVKESIKGAELIIDANKEVPGSATTSIPVK